MGLAIHVLAASASLLIGPAGTTSDIAAHRDNLVQVNFIDRLLTSNTRNRSKSSSHRRKKPAAAVPEAPPPEGMPATVPIPLPKPSHGEAAPAPIARPPVPPPETRPIPGEPPAEDLDSIKDAPSLVPKAQEGSHPAKVESEDAKPEQETDRSEDQPDIVHEDPAGLKQCLAELERIGAKVSKIDPIPSDNGCGIEAPVKVNEVLPGLPLGGATMRCETALGMALWLKNTVQPALDVAKPGRKLAGLVPGTTFACRLRNNAATGMISEHARGNAFDVAAFKLDNGEMIEMKPRKDDHTIEGAFQNAATAGACLYFTTVLAPGSDAAHETHLHVDVKDRENGYRICDFQ